jgi:hypothetical protein
MTTRRARKAQTREMVKLAVALVIGFLLLAAEHPWAAVGVFFLLPVLAYLAYLMRPIRSTTVEISQQEYARLAKEHDTPHVVALGPKPRWQDIQKYQADKPWRERHNIPEQDIPPF